MSHKNILRKDKTCLNCNYVVAERYCPNCGQENTESRKTFHHLFIHFIEDLTHYENSFWKTIKNLLSKPASLTTAYLSGKRLSYLAPIRLYIFISFVTFFILSLLPNDLDDELKNEEAKTEKIQTKSFPGGTIKINSVDEKDDDTIKRSSQELKLMSLYQEGKLTKKEFDTLVDYTRKSQEKLDAFSFGDKRYNSIAELDSIQKYSKDKLSPFRYWLTRKTMKIVHNKSIYEIFPLFLKSFRNNIPKALFVYMPIFALLLWIFHNKKRWYYFDHGIFTLHYFSFMLLVILLVRLLIEVIYLFGVNSISESMDIMLNLIVPLWFIFYFYKACKNFYQESRFVSFIKSSVLLILNTIILFFVLLFFIIYSFITIN